MSSTGSTRSSRSSSRGVPGGDERAQVRQRGPGRGRGPVHRPQCHPAAAREQPVGGLAGLGAALAGSRPVAADEGQQLVVGVVERRVVDVDRGQVPTVGQEAEVLPLVAVLGDREPGQAGLPGVEPVGRGGHQRHPVSQCPHLGRAARPGRPAAAGGRARGPRCRSDRWDGSGRRGPATAAAAAARPVRSRGGATVRSGCRRRCRRARRTPARRRAGGRRCGRPPAGSCSPGARRSVARRRAGPRTAAVRARSRRSSAARGPLTAPGSTRDGRAAPGEGATAGGRPSGARLGAKRGVRALLDGPPGGVCRPAPAGGPVLGNSHGADVARSPRRRGACRGRRGAGPGPSRRTARAAVRPAAGRAASARQHAAGDPARAPGCPASGTSTKPRGSSSSWASCGSSPRTSGGVVELAGCRR